ncbi:MAG TPA: IS110 family transposase [Burkholderiales bacterium]|nr:IS110 family transposase [Burkholderiales bacterium]
MRFIGLDVHRDFCEVAIAEAGRVRLAGRVKTEPEALALFAQSLAVEDEVALEATGNALGIARVIEPHVGRVVLANPKAVRGITQAGAKTDKIDARTLAKLLAGGFLPEVWLPDEQTRILRRRVSDRAQLVRQRTRAKNQVHATLIRNLKGKPPVSDLFGVRGRRWLAEQVLPADEQETVAACLRQIAFLDAEIALVECALARQVLASREMRRLLTLPGVNFVTAAALIAAIGEIDRFATARHLVSYLGFDPRVRQSGTEPARHGRISKQGPGEARHVLVEAAWHAARTTGPLHAFHERIAARRGSNVATVAVARKLAVIAWHMLSHGEDYAFARPTLTREKLRRLELMLGAERHKGKRNPVRVFASKEQHRLERELAAQAELAYRRLVQDWQPAINRGAGAAPGRASRGPSSGQAARQETAPPPAL